MYLKMSALEELMLKDAKKMFASAILTAALMTPHSLFAAPQQSGQTGGMQHPQGQGQGKENHPAIHEAIHHLEAAKDILEHKASHDFGGHRQQAIDSVNQALEHLHQALEYDKK
jgi:hypothetical protein